MSQEGSGIRERSKSKERDEKKNYRSSSRDRSRDSERGPKSLLVRNIPSDTRSDELKELMSKYGNIRDVYIPLDYYSKRPKGFAFVEYLSSSDAARALDAMDGYEFNDRSLKIVFAKESRKSSHEMRRVTQNSRYDDRRRYDSRDRYDRRRYDSRDRYDRRRDDSRDRYDRRRGRSRSRSRSRSRDHGKRYRSSSRDRDSKGGGGYKRSPSRDSRRSPSRSSSYDRKRFLCLIFIRYSDIFNFNTFYVKYYYCKEITPKTENKIDVFIVLKFHSIICFLFPLRSSRAIY